MLLPVVGGGIATPGSTPRGGWSTPSVRLSFLPSGSSELPLRPGLVSSGTVCGGGFAPRAFDRSSARGTARHGPVQARPISAQQGACGSGTRASSGWVSVPKRMPAASGSAAAPLQVTTAPTSAAGTAPRSSALRACHSVAGVERLEELHLAAGEQRDRQAVAVEHAVAGQRRELRAGGQDADQVQRVGAGQRHELARAPACGGSRAAAPTASGSANCSPEKPATKRPPRISPRASSRR